MGCLWLASNSQWFFSAATLRKILSWTLADHGGIAYFGFAYYSQHLGLEKFRIWGSKVQDVPSSKDLDHGIRWISFRNLWFALSWTLGTTWTTRPKNAWNLTPLQQWMTGNSICDVILKVSLQCTNPELSWYISTSLIQMPLDSRQSCAQHIWGTGCRKQQCGRLWFDRNYLINPVFQGFSWVLISYPPTN